jgi:K+-sensing histidine kinase KdpD
LSITQGGGKNFRRFVEHSKHLSRQIRRAGLTFGHETEQVFQSFNWKTVGDLLLSDGGRGRRHAMAHSSGTNQFPTQERLNGFAQLTDKMLRHCTSGWRRTASYYVASFLTVGLATGLRIGLDPVLGEHHPFTIYFAAVAITAWYGGFAPALVATMLAYLAADWFFVSPRFEFNWPHTNLDEFIALLAFLFSSLAIAYTSKIMRQALEKARQKQRELEREIVERERAEKNLQQAQGQLRRYAALLEERVAERTGHLQETVRSLEGVCYHIAHDLRAPLRAMEGYSKILLNQYAPRFDAAGEGYANRISEAAAQMELLIRGLLEYGRLGHEQFAVEAIESGVVLDKVLALLKGEIARRQAEVKIQGEWPCVAGNEKLFEIVLISLLSNALKFVATGVAPRVIVRGESHANVVRFSIEDNGIGIAPEYLHKVFRIFERLHSKDSYAGTGIGLAIATKAAERMGGELGVESKLNQGSRFWIELPGVRENGPERNLEKGHDELVVAG